MPTGSDGEIADPLILDPKPWAATREAVLSVIVLTLSTVFMKHELYANKRSYIQKFE